MKKLYVKKISNKEGKELFKNEIVRQIIVKGKTYNLVGSVDNYTSGEEVIICSYLTQRMLTYGVIGQIFFKVNENTKNGFMILK